MADHQEASVTLPSDPVSVPTARRYVADVLADWGLPDETETADAIRLIVSELDHQRRPAHLRSVAHLHRGPAARAGRANCIIGVTDSHPRWPQRLPAAVRQDNGRGMVIIRSLAKECGGRLTVTPDRRRAARPSGSSSPGRSPSRPDRRPRGPGPRSGRHVSISRQLAAGSGSRQSAASPVVATHGHCPAALPKPPRSSARRGRPLARSPWCTTEMVRRKAAGSSRRTDRGVGAMAATISGTTAIPIPALTRAHTSA